MHGANMKIVIFYFILDIQNGGFPTKILCAFLRASYTTPPEQFYLTRINTTFLIIP